MLELRRNPGGSIDKRFRPTLRPMSKTRRDSSASELESKLKDVKSLNSKYRKTLLEKESELQMLIRRLGSEAREILDSRTDSMSDTNRLSVPLIRKEPPSATETSDITSLCSLSSQDYASLHHTDSQKKKKPSSGESPKAEKPIQNSPRPPDLTEQDRLRQANGSLARPSLENLKVDSNYNSVKDTLGSEFERARTNPGPVEVKKDEPKTVKTPVHERRASKALDLDLMEKRRTSIKPELLPEPEEVICPRRVSVPSNRTTPKKKPECGTHVVAKSELWDTGNQHRCMKSHQKSSRVSISQDEDSNHMQRTVSERNRHSSQKEKREKSPVAKKEMPTNICNQQCNKLGYFQSTPNVAALKTNVHTPKRDKSMYNATSESELLDREILPIFQKLLTERNKSQHNIDYSFGRSCPNISIKCDIVEYL